MITNVFCLVSRETLSVYIDRAPFLASAPSMNMIVMIYFRCFTWNICIKESPFFDFLPFFNILRVFNGVQTLVFEKEVLSMRRAGMRLFSIVLFDRWLNAEAPCGSTRFVFDICGNYRSIIYSFCFCVISRTFSLIQEICFNTHSITYFPCHIAFVRWMFNVKHMRVNIFICAADPLYIVPW